MSLIIHPKSGYSLFVYEMCRRRVLGTTKKEFREIGHDFGIKDVEGYFDWDDNSHESQVRVAKSKESPARATNQNGECNSRDKLNSGGTHREI